MSYFDNVTNTLRILDKWQRILFCATCVERISPVVSRWGQPETQKWFREGLDAMWISAGGRDILGLSGLINTAQTLQETQIEEPEPPIYEVFCSLGVLDYSLKCIESQKCFELSKSVAEEMIGILSGFDGDLDLIRQSKSSEKTVALEFRTLEAQEIMSQWRLIQRIALMPQLRLEDLKEVRYLSSKMAESYRKILEVIAGPYDRALKAWVQSSGW